MHAGRSGLLVAALIALVGCEQSEPDQNIIITNNIPADAEVEALPPDESSATPTEELVNGAPDENAAASDNLTNSY